MSEEIKEEVAQAEEAEVQMTPEEAVAAVEAAAKSFIDMIGKANDTLKSITEVGGEGLDGLGDDAKKAAEAIGVTVDKVTGTAKEIIGVLTPEEAAEEAEAAPAEEE